MDYYVALQFGVLFGALTGVHSQQCSSCCMGDVTEASPCIRKCVLSAAANKSGACGSNCVSTSTDPCLQTLVFTGQPRSYIMYEHSEWRPFVQTAIRYSFSLTLEFRTTASQGIIFFSSSGSATGDYISLHIDGGNVHCHNDDTNPAAFVNTNGTYNDGTWHKVMCSKQNNALVLIVDDEDVEISTSPSSRSTSTNNDYYLGGIKTASQPRNVQNKLGFSAGFDGCIRNFRINNLCPGVGHDHDNVQFCENC